MTAAPSSAVARPPARWDLFCRVVDNFGDAGVTWRLARELADEHGLAVTLWIDDPTALTRLVPNLRVDAAEDHETERQGPGIRVRRWPVPWRDGAPPDVVLEMFGADLPDAYVDAMAASSPQAQWFVVEYLSAETWVDAHHALPSPHARVAVRRRFWFPGFTPATGGLLRERHLLAHRDAFARDDAGRAALWRDLGIVEIGAGLRTSLFCYPAAPMTGLLDAWARAAEPTVCLLPQGIGGDTVQAWLAARARRHGRAFVAGSLTVHAIPFVPQARYDEILWSCDFNFVRGEDSFVRAQWAAHPFAWQIYPQPGNAHAPKMEAFLDRYLERCDAVAAARLRAFWHAWNALSGAAFPAAAWDALRTSLPTLERHAVRWSRRLATLPELAATLVGAAAIGV